MDTTCFSESIYNLIPIDWKEPPQPPRYVGKQRLSPETRIGNNYAISGLTEPHMTLKNNINFCLSEVVSGVIFIRKWLQNLGISHLTIHREGHFITLDTY